MFVAMTEIVGGGFCGLKQFTMFVAEHLEIFFRCLRPKPLIIHKSTDHRDITVRFPDRFLMQF